MDALTPRTLADALRLRSEVPDALAIQGGTDVMVELNFDRARPPALLNLNEVRELRGWSRENGALRLGASLTYTECRRELGELFPALAEASRTVGSPQIQNRGTIGGNLGTASPIGDTAPVLLALDATVLLVSPDGEREVPVGDYFVAYRQTVCRPGELIRAVRIPLPLAPVTSFIKIAKRRFDDISSVAVGVAIDVQDGIVRRARIGLGGVAATPVRARATEEVLTGRPWSRDTVQEAADVLPGVGTPLSDHRASAAYRTAMLRTALLKVYATNPSAEVTA